jgi:hypothetical protein
LDQRARSSDIKPEKIYGVRYRNVYKISVVADTMYG